MSDLIDRQAAIDAICKACSMEEDYHKCYGYPETSTWCDVLVALRALPSAQSETIIHCEDCKYEDGVCYCELHFMDVKPDGFCYWADRKIERREDE